MQTVYVPKSNLYTFVAPPGPPTDIDNYYAVEVPDVFVLPRFHKYNVASGKFEMDAAQQETVIRDGMNVQINAWRDYQREHSFVEYNGKRFDANQQARENLLGIINTGSLPLPFWTSYDNEDVPVTMDDIKGIYLAVVQLGGRIHERQRVMKEEVATLPIDQVPMYAIGW